MEIADIRRELGLENLEPDDIDRIKFQLQTLNDTIQGGLRSANLIEYRNTYVINAQDSLDATYPMYVHFNIISEMTRIVSIKLSFWFLNFRAYSTGAKEKIAVTSGASSETSSGASSAASSDGGGVVSSASGGGHTSSAASGGVMGIQVLAKDEAGHITTWQVDASPDLGHTHIVANHAHIGGSHTHNIPHTHNIEHTHTIPAHSHDIVFGIHEEETSPTIVPSISRDNGSTYSLPLGSYQKDQETLDITRFIDKAGSKIIKFTSTTRARLSVQIEIKLDIRAR